MYMLVTLEGDVWSRISIPQACSNFKIIHRLVRQNLSFSRVTWRYSGTFHSVSATMMLWTSDGSSASGSSIWILTTWDRANSQSFMTFQTYHLVVGITKWLLQTIIMFWTMWCRPLMLCVQKRISTVTNSPRGSTTYCIVYTKRCVRYPDLRQELCDPYAIFSADARFQCRILHPTPRGMDFLGCSEQYPLWWYNRPPRRAAVHSVLYERKDCAQTWNSWQ